MHPIVPFLALAALLLATLGSIKLGEWLADRHAANKSINGE